MLRRFVIAAGTFDEPDVERAHAKRTGVDIEVDMASMRTPAEVAAATHDADGVIVTNNPLPAELVAALGERVRVIGRAGIGLDAIDLDAVAARGIGVVHFPDYATGEVATHTIAMLLAVNRRIVAADRVAREDWPAWRSVGAIAPLHEQTAGVVGCGRIGRAVVERLVPLVGRVVVHDPMAAELPAGAEAAPSLDALLSQSDVVTLHLPLTAESRHLIGARELALLPPGAILVNASRGGLVDEAALVDALRSGALGGAALDSIEHEPPDAGDPLLAAPNLVLAPHLGWYSEASEPRVRAMAVDGMLDYLDGRPLRAGRVAVQGGRQG